MFIAAKLPFINLRDWAFKAQFAPTWLFGSSAYAQTSRDAGGDDTGVIVLILIILVVYFIPTIVAFSRKHPNRWIIGVINTVFGGTGLGWLGSLVWALNAVHKSAAGSDGGESGLNLFVNDPVKVQLTQFPAVGQAHPNTIDQLQKLKALHEQGIITDDDFVQLKKPLLEALFK